MSNNSSSDDEPENCAICFDPMQIINSDCSILLQDLYSLPCKHQYHRACITEWLKKESTCPLCRGPVKPEPQLVDDGIITEDRRQELILIGRDMLIGVGSAIGYILNMMNDNSSQETNLNDLGQLLSQSIRDGDFDNVIGDLVDKYVYRTY